MSLDNAKNFAKVTVSTGYDAAATSIVLTTGHGAKLPTAPFNVVWYNSTDYSDPSDDPNVEVVRVTAISTDTLTVTRAQESTSASTKNTSAKTYKMIAGLTAKVINTDIPGLAPSGIGWSLKSYTTASAAASVSIGSLGLVSDGRYKVILDCEPTGGTNTGVTLTVNGASSGYYWIWNLTGESANSGQNNSGLSNTGTYGRLSLGGTPILYLHQLELDFTALKADGSTVRVAWSGRGGAYTGASTNTVVGDLRFAGSSGQTDLTTLLFTTNNDNGNNCNWRVWVYKLTTS